MPPAEVAVRAPTPRDAAGIAEVLNAHAAATGRPADETAERVERWFELEDLDPARDMFLAVEGGRIVGYADVSAPGAEREVVNVDLRVPPQRTSVVERLLQVVERRAAELGDAGARIHAPANEGDVGYRAALSRHGFQVVRSSFTMEIDLVRPTKSPVWPAGLTSRPFEPGEERAVYDAYVEAFADHWGFVPESFADWCTWNLGPNRDTSLWRLVQDGADIAALSMSAASRGDDHTVGWVGVLAVRRPWRRRGLARALLLESFGLFRSIGRSQVALGVDSENTTGALALYQGVGMRATSRSDTWERAL
ncbi:MAG TPA: GNAT family N-acetyltransferase [Gaiella sp.]|nr:GNAT family N-acetyltransferase [Gaiella sp.]